jgi:hypothetical protein
MNSDIFKSANAAALSSGLLQSLYPQAKRQGDNLRLGNLAGDKGSSLWICLRTGAWKDHATGESGGDLISLCAAREGISQSAAMYKISGGAYQYNHPAPCFPPSPPDTTKVAKIAKVAHALQLWRETLQAENSPVKTYLRGRAITCPIPPDIRFHPALSHKDSGQCFPAMVTAIRNSLSGEIIAIHRTWLTLDGNGKALVKPNKMILGQCKGGAVQLAPAAPKMAIAEGIETALSVMQETDLPVWAALSTSGMTGLELPSLPAASEIIIAGDNDPPGRKAAYQAAELFTKKRRKAFTAFPPNHNDYNDILQGQF